MKKSKFHEGKMRKPRTLLLTIFLIATIGLFGCSKHGNLEDTRKLMVVTCYEPFEMIDEPVKGAAKEIVEIFESKTEMIEDTETYFGGLWFTVQQSDNSSIHYTIAGGKLHKSVTDSKDNVLEMECYKFSDEELEKIRSLMDKIPKTNSDAALKKRIEID